MAVIAKKLDELLVKPAKRPLFDPAMTELNSYLESGAEISDMDKPKNDGRAVGYADHLIAANYFKAGGMQQHARSVFPARVEFRAPAG